MFSQVYLAASGLVFMVAVFVVSFVLLRQYQRKQDFEKSEARARGGLNPEEERRLKRHLERAALREERERRELAAREAEETARPNQYKEKLRLREEERLERERIQTEAAKLRDKELDKWKSSISKVDEGNEEPLHNISSVEEFIQYIFERKIVDVESLASTFRIEISQAVSRINDLISQSRLFGVFDDRGRFIRLLHSEVAAIQQHISTLNSRRTLKEICSQVGSIVAVEPS